MDTLSRDDIERIAADVRSAELANSDRAVGWPDCFDVSHAIRETLEDDYDVPEDAMSVEQFLVGDGVHHYALHLDYRVTGAELIVDASFDQFGAETEVPIDIAPSEDIASVVVAPAGRYVFH